jgi:hypothetical protein
MKQTPIEAIETVQRILYAHHEQLRGKAPEERTAFYRAKAREMRVQVTPQLQAVSRFSR